MASIHLDRLSKRYPNGVVAVDRLDLRVDDGELVALVGPSGCGKSTVLRLVAGLETPSDGRVIIDGADATDKPPQARDLAMVFQSYALYPHKTIRENLAFGLRMRHTPTQVIEQRVRAAAQALQLDAVLDRKPAQLSGGQRQRVALGRAMVRHPKAFLLDEPLSNLDARLRVDTRAELARLRRRLGATMLYVTHDQEEAMTLGDRLAVLRDGVLQQVADPRTVYRKPANVFVAGFIGSPAMNLFDATLRRPGGAGSLETPWMAVPLGGSAGATAASGPVVAGIRPHDLLLTAAAEEEARGRVAVLESLGREQLVHVDVGDPGAATSLVALVPARDHLRLDQEVGVRVQRDRLHFFDAATGARLPSPTDADTHT